jgi:hypothetical protein
MAHRTFVASEDVLARTVGDEVVLLHLSTEKYLGLSGSAAAMWLSLLERGTIEGALAVLVEQFDVSEEILRADLERFADELVGRGLLHG